MATVHMSLSFSTTTQSLSSSKVLSGQSPTYLFLTNKPSLLSLTSISFPFKSITIRMGGGPRTYPGGVSKWQWKRMQANKAKQLLKARLARERQIYEMRKRSELKAAVSELERPWEVVEKAPTLFSVSADEQLKVLADRFQKPGGFDMWSENDGPQLFQTVDGIPSARFFPKGVVHSIKPYGKIENALDSDVELRNSYSDWESERELQVKAQRFENNKNFRKSKFGSSGEGNVGDLESGSEMEMKVGRFGSGKNIRNSRIGSIGEGKVANWESGNELKTKVHRFSSYKNSRKSRTGSSAEEEVRDLNFRSSNEALNEGKRGKSLRGKIRSRNGKSSFGGMDTKSRGDRIYQGQRERNRIHKPYANDSQFIRDKNLKEYKDLNSEVYDMSLQQDGIYGFGSGNDLM